MSSRRASRTGGPGKKTTDPKLQARGAKQPDGDAPRREAPPGEEKPSRKAKAPKQKPATQARGSAGSARPSRRAGGRGGAARSGPREVSAGGVVVRDGDVAVIVPTRRSADGSRVLSLPKGHVDPGETPVEAAEREVREETGVV